MLTSVRHVTSNYNCFSRRWELIQLKLDRTIIVARKLLVDLRGTSMYIITGAVNQKVRCRNKEF